MWWRRAVGLVVLLAVACPRGVVAAEPTPAPPAPETPAASGPTAPPAQQAIAIPQIASAAEDTMARLRAIEVASQPLRAVAAIEERLPDLEKNVASGTDETYRVLKENPSSLAALDELLDPWANARDQAQTWLTILTSRAEDLEALLERLEDIRAHWTLTQAAAADAPEATVGRIQDTLALVDSAHATVEQRRAEVLVLQDRVAQVLARSDEMLDQVQATRRSLLGQLFVRDGLPIWGFFMQTEAWQRARDLASHSISAEVPITRLFIREHATLMIAEFGFFLALGFWFRRMQQHARRWTSLDDSLAARFRPLEHPFAAAALLTLIIVSWMAPPEPRALRAAAALAAMVPMIRLLASLTSRQLVPAVWIVGAFHVVDLVRSLLTAVPLLEQAIFLVELSGLVLAIAWLRRHLMREELAASRERWDRIGRVALCLGAVALVAAALGWVRLARLIEFALISAAQWALILWALVRLSDALLAWALRVRPLRQLRAVQEHREGVERRLQGILRFVALLFWGVGLASTLSILEPVSQRIASVLGARVGWGAINISLGDLLAFAIVVWLTFLVSQALRAILEQDVFPRVTLRRGIAAALSSLAHYAILLIGFLLGLGALGIDLTRITILAGALGVGVGFGLQNVVNNFVSGLILLFERPIQVGDSVQLGTLTGEVKRIGIRSSTVRTFDGAEVIVPNASLVSDQVTNWTLSDRMRRIDLNVGVEYGADPAQVVALLTETARACTGVLPDPPPVVLFFGFGDSALNFEVRVWTARFEEWLRTRSELGIAVHGALKSAGIGIPFPQRDVRIVQEQPEPTPR